jgi:hypothetical protein
MCARKWIAVMIDFGDVIIVEKPAAPSPALTSFLKSCREFLRPDDNR